MKKTSPPFPARKPILIGLAVVYAGMAGLAAWNVIAHSQASTRAIEQVLELHSLQNEAEQSLDRYAQHHPILGMFFSAPVKSAFDLPSREAADEALHSEVPHLLREVRRQSSLAAWWSCFLVGSSLLYAAGSVALERRVTTRPVLFSLTLIGVTFFVVGVLAPAMIIWTAPNIPIESDHLKFVLQHEVRGIAVIIRQLISAGHWIIGGFLLLFSIVTPLTKASLTFFVTASRSRPLNSRIARLLHSIGKWSMADVCVAGVLLALYALKFQEATHSIPCIGLAYFIGYCLLSMTTTELLIHSEAVGHPSEKARRPLGPRTVAAVLAAALGLVGGAIAYTYAQYPLVTPDRGAATSLPQKLKAAELGSPAQK